MPAATYKLLIGSGDAEQSSTRLRHITNKLNVDPCDSQLLFPSGTEPPGDPTPPEHIETVDFFWLIDILFKIVKKIENLEEE